MTAADIRQKFLDFFAAPEHGYHKIRPSSSLIPDDPSVLLTSAGMQQFKPYFLGEPSPWGPNVVSVQKCFRTSDIDEVGDERHLTFFEMLGNFSFGGYGKKEAIEYAHEFITQELGLTIDYVSVFDGLPAQAGAGEIPADEESAKIWRQIDPNLEIKEFGRADNFWGPTGTEGPCGPTTEIYVNGIEIWNLVFNQYYQKADGSLEPLELFGIDTGMGLERLAMVVRGKKSLYDTDIFTPLTNVLPADLPERDKRIIADHTRAVCHLIEDGVRPGNKGAEYILRRLIRRMVIFGKGVKFEQLLSDGPLKVFNEEREQFTASLKLGEHELNKLSSLDATAAFKLFETYGLPYEIIAQKFPQLRREDFEAEFKKHQEISRAGVEKKFAGGLADHEPATIKLHTAHHLLLKSLQIVLGKEVKQRGSNITAERLRLDFSWSEKLTDEQKKEVERIVNEKIKEDLPVIKTEMAKEEAEKLGAEHEFGAKYPDRVSIYSIGPLNRAFSIEFCGGPHVPNTGELGTFKISKEEAVAQGIRRIRGVLV